MYYKISDLAKMFSVSKETIRRMITSGRIKAIKFAGDWRISEEEVERLKKGE